MSDLHKVILKPGREKSLLNRHPWIFSGAIESLPDFASGDVLNVYSCKEQFLCKAYFHSQNSISGRVLTFIDESIEKVLEERIVQAIAYRNNLFNPATTNCYRLINAEGDGLPGLIVDIYDSVAVIQVNTCGMERLKNGIVQVLLKEMNLKGIFEKSESSARRQEGLEDFVGVLFGECPKEILVKENGICFLVNVHEGQKTGFFLDQREMRQRIGLLSKNKRVLNCFSYTGGFSLFALQGGATSVTSIDASEEACRYAKENTLLNGIALEKHEVMRGDVFDFLKTDVRTFDLVILDPPAFAKKRQDIDVSCRGYKQINRCAMEKMPANSYLLTSSCSHFIDEDLFQQVVFQAAIEAKRDVAICSRHIQAMDHPVSLFHREGSYLKSLLLHIK